MSQLQATSVRVVPGDDVRTRRLHELHRVVGAIRHAATGQEGVALEGPAPGQYTFYTLAAFASLFEPTPGPPAADPPLGRELDHTHMGKGL